MADQYVALPDGSYVQIPDTATPDQLAAFKDKLRQKFPAQDITNPEEMTERGPGAPGAAPMPKVEGHNPHIPLAAQEQAPGANVFQMKHVIPALETAATVAPLVIPFAETGSLVNGAKLLGRGVVGSAIGATGGRYAGGAFGPTGQKIGETVGALGGGILGGMDELPMMPKALRPTPEPGSPAAMSVATREAVREGSAAKLPTRMPKAGGIGVVGSPEQEAGYQPPVLRVPAPTGIKRVTPEQIPGPDTAGKGNILTPLAKAGEEGAGAELLRRGRKIIYTVPTFEK